MNRCQRRVKVFNLVETSDAQVSKELPALVVNPLYK